MTSRIELGAVIFDSEDHPGMGWACRSGEDPFRIAGVQSLSSDTLWWVSIDYQRMANAGLAQHAFFRGEAFLRLSVTAMLTELGLRNAEGSVAEPGQAAARLAAIFDRVVTLHCAFSGVARERWRPPRTVLRSALRETLMPPDERLDATLDEAVREAGQAFTRCRPPATGNQRKHRSLCFMPAPRLAHAQAILDCPVPANTAYERISPPNALDRVDAWLDEYRGPMLLRVSIENFPSEISRLVNFGAVAGTYAQGTRENRGYTAASSRQWITSDEARVYAQFADLEILEALWWPQWAQPSAIIPSVASFFERIDPLDHLSYALGLFAENIWTALTLVQPPHYSERDAVQNVIAPFLRAADRMECLRHAIRISNQGVDVMGFGVGRIGAFLTEGTPGASDKALRIAATAGLTPPFPAHGVGAMPAPPIVSDDEVYRSLVEMVGSDMRETFDELDAEVVTAFTDTQPHSAAL